MENDIACSILQQHVIGLETKRKSNEFHHI